ncbi:MAG: acylphosphatase [Gallionellaceae bacterium]
MTDHQTANNLTLYLIVYGDVQGVFYRDSMKREAERHSVAGWVRNRRDGTVEAVLHGDPGAVNAVVLWARRGPPQARVEHVSVKSIDSPCTGFEIRPTL